MRVNPSREHCPLSRPVLFNPLAQCSELGMHPEVPIFTG
ncbi:hypothetical protein NOC27_2025 [Nitrosococcus oceani AFC27]|nr:hypothetical protein NOC27_2025 [Nitrosococcus oceani AFC27]